MANTDAADTPKTFCMDMSTVCDEAEVELVEAPGAAVPVPSAMSLG